MKFLIISILVALATAESDDWYKTASFYQIYPQTFFDGGGGNRGGYGTLKGVEAKLDYIKSLGIDCIWMTPIFETTYNSFGYDITNYEEIDARFGSKEIFKQLVDAVHAKGMKIIVDFVPNHCGYEHEFFKKSVLKDSEYENWFVWSDGKGTNKSQPPSNWQRIGKGPGSGWNYNLKRDQWFYAVFSDHMPDLNLREPKVIAYWEKFLKLWLDFGLDGFRVDAISHGFEKVLANGTYPDEEINQEVSNQDDFSYLQHTNTLDQPELFDLIYNWRGIFNSYNGSTRFVSYH